MKLPKIGDTIKTGWAVKLCRHFDLDYLVERISKNMDGYKDWKFDGCSMLPNNLIGFLFRSFWKRVILEAALPHDLAYAYGEPGNVEERKEADFAFYGNLRNAGMWKFVALRFYVAVRIGGAEKLGLSFTWAFAQGQVESKEVKLPEVP